MKFLTVLLAVSTLAVSAQTHRILAIDLYTGDPSGTGCTVENKLVQSSTTGLVYACKGGHYAVNGPLAANPMAYSARGDGSTDDLAAFQAAHAASPAISLPALTFAIKSGIVDIAGSASSSLAYSSLIGVGRASTINCSPSTTQEACVRVYNGARSTLENLTITCNANVTYCVEFTSTGAAEDGHLENVAINGGQYGVAISPTSHFDIAHINLYNVSIRAAAVADLVIGDGVQSNVLDNRCFGCTFDTSAGDGVLIRGGGFSCYGCDWDSVAGIDVNVTTPPDQTLVLHGGRSEHSKAFFSYTGGNSSAMPATDIDGISWFAAASPNTYTITNASASAISITNSRFASTSNAINFLFGSFAGHPGSLYMANVGTSNAAWGSVLAALVAGGTKLFSVGDYYLDPTTFQKSPGTGLIWTSDAYLSPLTTPASSSAACVAGQYTDDASYHYVCTAANTWKRVALTAF